MLKEFEIIDFDVIRENWNEYLIEDGTKLRVKFIMIKVLKNKNMGEDYRFNCTHVIGITSPLNRSGQPSVIHDPKEVLNSIIQEDIGFKEIKVDWNEYRLKDNNKIMAKPVITLIQKTDKFDEFGDPIYNIQIQAIFKALPKKKLR